MKGDFENILEVIEGKDSHIECGKNLDISHCMGRMEKLQVWNGSDTEAAIARKCLLEKSKD